MMGDNNIENNNETGEQSNGSEYADLFSGSGKEQGDFSNRNQIDGQQQNHSSEERDYQDQYHYYQFSNNSPNKDIEEIKREMREEKNRQPIFHEERRSSGNTGFGIKKGVALVVMFLLLGIAAGLGFLVTTYVGREKLGNNEASVSDTNIKHTENEADVRKNTNENVTPLQGYQVLNDVSEIVKKNKPAMVNISATTKTVLQDFFRGSYYQEVPISGSGFIISEDDKNYYIATNHHVIDNGRNLSVAFIDNSVAPAVVKGKDAYNDLAVISVSKEDVAAETQKNIKLVEIGDSENLVEGQAVIAMGNALGYGQSTTVGIISALDRTIQTEDGMIMEHLIQTDAAINFGNSGGALIDATGRVIGINSAKNGSAAVEGMGYAIPISKAEPIIRNILLDDRVIVAETKRGMLGVSGLNTGEDAKRSYGIPVGFYINEVKDGGGAKNAGIMRGDVIVEIDGFKVRTQRDIAERLQFFEVGEKVEVTIMRQIDGEYKELKKNVAIMSKDKALIKQEEKEKQWMQDQQKQEEVPDKFEQNYDKEDSPAYEDEEELRNKLDNILEEMFRRP